MLWKRVLQQTLLSSQLYSLNPNEILFIKTTAALLSIFLSFAHFIHRERPLDWHPHLAERAVRHSQRSGLSEGDKWKAVDLKKQHERGENVVCAL